MSNKLNPISNFRKPKIYQIRIKDHLGNQWSNWFDGLTITQDEDGNTLLTGPVVDDAALHGLLKKVRDLGMSLLSVNLVSPDQSDAEDKKKDNKEEDTK